MIVNRLVVKQSSSSQVADRRTKVGKAPSGALPPITKQHAPDHRPSVAVDFDGRIAEQRDDLDLSQTPPREGARQALERFRQAGITVIIWTARSDADAVKAWLAQHGIPFDAFNANPDFETGSRKLVATVYLDDRGEGDPDASWDDLVDLVFYRVFGKARQPVDSWEELEELAQRAQPELEKLLGAVAPDAGVLRLSDDLLLGELESRLLQPGPVIVLPSVKSFKRAREKVESDYGGDWDKLLDVNRAAIAFDTKKELDAAAERLRNVATLARPPKDRFDAPLGNGYRDFMINPRLPCGMICEVQLHRKPVLLAREREKLSYDVVRAIHAALDREGRDEMSPAEAEAVRRARKMAKNLYARAWQECLAKDGGIPEAAQKSGPVNRLKQLVARQEKDFNDNVRSAGEWLAEKWATLEKLL